MTTATRIRYVRRWPAEAGCDAPGCHENVGWCVVFENARPIDTLYLCTKHKDETVSNYAHA